MEQHIRHILRDLLIVSLSVAAAIFIARSGLVEALNGQAGDWFVLSAFIAGAFFTSIFTTAPATVVLGYLALHHDPFIIALCGATGSLVVDSLILRIFHDHLSEDFMYLLKHVSTRRMRELGRLRAVRWLMPLLGGLIIASPLPDELGLLVLGMSRMPNRLFVPLTYIFNFIGILTIGLIARSMAFQT